MINLSFVGSPRLVLLEDLSPRLQEMIFSHYGTPYMDKTKVGNTQKGKDIEASLYRFAVLRQHQIQIGIAKKRKR